MKIHKTLHLNRINIAMTVVALVLLVGLGAYVYTRDTKPTPVSNPVSAPTSPSGTANNTPATTPNSTPKPAPANTAAFSISKVHFAAAPKVPTGAGFGQCQLGQQFSYQAQAQLTATNKGVATYHWEQVDHHVGTVIKSPDQTVTFAAAGQQTVTGDFSFTTHDVGNGTNYNDRMYLNVMVTSPNQTYANIDTPVYAYQGTKPVFVWGTYIDLC